jgi:murein DD-endopeptidase MepM/ murein hydrolase activator NlpD
MLKKQIMILVLISSLWCVPLLAHSSHNRSKKHGHKNPPPPVQCVAGNLETHGHLLSISPALGRAATSREQTKLTFLSGDDPVGLSQLLNNFKDSEKQILDVKLGDAAPQLAFKSLKNFVEKKKFKGPAEIQIAGVLEKNQIQLKASEEKLINELNGKNLEYFKTKITKRWLKKNDQGDQSIFLQLELQTKTVFVGIELHDGSQECLETLSKKERKILPEGISETIIPKNYSFISPIAPPFDITYFYGPRIFNSMNLSMALERNPNRIPESLPNKKDRAMEYINEYWQFHSGVDFSVRTGTPVSAVSDGVVFAKGPMGCAGNAIVLAHTLPETGKIVFSVYEHLQGPAKKRRHSSKNDKVRALAVGDKVEQGQLIALSGKSGTKVGFTHGFKEGCVGGAHLHFEVRAPRVDSLDLKRDLASRDMSKRFQFVQSETVSINPADFIKKVDDACKFRKSIETENIYALQTEDIRKIPPITAGLCGLKYERSLKSVPSIYRLNRVKDSLTLAAKIL